MSIGTQKDKAKRNGELEPQTREPEVAPTPVQLVGGGGQETTPESQSGEDGNVDPEVTGTTSEVFEEVDPNAPVQEGTILVPEGNDEDQQVDGEVSVDSDVGNTTVEENSVENINQSGEGNDAATNSPIIET